MRVFRLPEATAEDPAIASWLKGKPEALVSIARRWFARMRECGGDVLVTMHDGQPTACVQDAAFGYVNVFTAHVNIGFFNGAVLEDPAGLLEGAGKFMRHVKIKPGAEPDSSALADLIAAAYQDMKAREIASRKRP